MDLSKGNQPADPQTFKGYLATVTLHPDRAEITRKPMGKIFGNKNTTIPLTDITKMQWREPTKLVNGYACFATNEDQGRLAIFSTQDMKTIGGNPRTILFTWGQRDTLTKLQTAVTAALARIDRQS